MCQSKGAGNFKKLAEDAVSTAIHSKKERMSDIIIIYNNSSNSYNNNNNNNNNKNNILHIALMNRYNNALEGSTSMVRRLVRRRQWWASSSHGGIQRGGREGPGKRRLPLAKEVVFARSSSSRSSLDECLKNHAFPSIHPEWLISCEPKLL